MAAIPFRQDAPKHCILEICNTDYTLDPYRDRLTSQGYEVITTRNYGDALKAAHDGQPVLIVLYDDPKADIDTLHWLEMQHTDPNPKLAMTPLLVLAESARVPTLNVEAIADRVVVLQRRADTLNQLTRTVKRLLRLSQMD